MKTKKKLLSTEGIELPKKDICDRCGNDTSKGTYYYHLPYRKMYIAFCHICHYGLMYGFYADMALELRKIKEL